MIILDTHIWVWWVNRNPNLTEQLQRLIQDRQADGLGVSIFSCWEVAKLVEKNRIVLSQPVAEWLNTALAYPGVRLLDLTLPIVVRSLVNIRFYYNDTLALRDRLCQKYRFASQKQRSHSLNQ